MKKPNAWAKQIVAVILGTSLLAGIVYFIGLQKSIDPQDEKSKAWLIYNAEHACQITSAVIDKSNAPTELTYQCQNGKTFHSPTLDDPPYDFDIDSQKGTQ